MIILGQIGIGSWGKNHLRNFSRMGGCAVKMCCDKNRSILDGITSEYKGKVGCTTDPEDIFLDKEIDAVIVTTPPVMHAKMAISALNNGKHVFVEKPLAMNVEEGREIKKAAIKHKKICMVGHILLYHPAVRMLKKYIDDRVLGHVHYMYSTRVNLGQIRKEENVLWSLTCHDISVAMYLLGKHPQSVSAIGKSYLRHKVEDIVFVNMSFMDNVMANVHASWLDPHKVRQFTVVGSKKMAVFDDMGGSEKLKIYDKGVDKVLDENLYEAFLTLRSGDIFAPKIEMEEPLKLECEAFLDAINNNEQPLANVDNGIEVLRVLEAAQKSLDHDGLKVALT